MTLRRLAYLAVALACLAGGQLVLDGAASAAPVTLPMGLAGVSATQGAYDPGYRYVTQYPSRLTGPMELGGVLDLVDLTLDGFSCSADEPFVDPVCGTHTVAVTGTERQHPSVAQPKTPKYGVSGSCEMPSSLGATTVFISCALHIGDDPRELGMKVRVTVGAALYSGDLVDWCSLEPPTVCEDPVPVSVSTDYGSVYQQR